jgi:hypothetical protein
LAEAEGEPGRRQQLEQQSGVPELRAYLTRTLDDRGRLRLKLHSALGVGQRLLDDFRRAIDERLGLLRADRDTSRAIERHLEQHAADQQREFAYRLDRLDNLLHDLTERGERFFEQNLRLGRIFDLFNAEKVRADFEREVVADAPQRVEDLTQELIDWMVDQDQRLWQWVTREVERRAESAPEVARGRVELPFSEDRRAVLQALMRTTREVLRRHDHRREAEQLAASVRDTVTRTTLVEAGALGLGAITMAIVGSAAADVTGLLAASAMAGLGLYLLPLRRRRASQQLRERTQELRESLSTALRREFERSLDASLGRVRSALAPYERFVESELERLQGTSRELDRFGEGFQRVRREIDEVPTEVGRVKGEG